MTLLTYREKQIFNYMINGYNTNQIASFLHISEKTVRNHISNVIIKLDVKDRVQAVIKLIKMKELNITDNI